MIYSNEEEINNDVKDYIQHFFCKNENYDGSKSFSLEKECFERTNCALLFILMAVNLLTLFLQFLAYGQRND